MVVRPGAEATELAVARLMGACPDGEAFRLEAISLLQRVVGFDGWCWARLDPRCRLPAHGSLADKPADPVSAPAPTRRGPETQPFSGSSPASSA